MKNKDLPQNAKAISNDSNNAKPLEKSRKTVQKPSRSADRTIQPREAKG